MSFQAVESAFNRPARANDSYHCLDPRSASMGDGIRLGVEPVRNHHHEPLSAAHTMGLLARLRHVDHLLSEIDSALRAGLSPRAFPDLAPDISRDEALQIGQHVQRIRKQLLDFLEELGIDRPAPPASARQAVRVALILIRVALEELEITKMRGHGQAPDWFLARLDRFVQKLRAEIENLHEFVRGSPPDSAGGLEPSTADE